MRTTDRSPERLRVGLLTTVNGLMSGRIIQTLLKHEVTIDALVFDSKDVSQRDFDLHAERTGGRLPPIALHTFERHNIPCYFVEHHNSEAAVYLIKALKLDILINAGTPRILKRPILESTTIGVLNCHPGLLPNFRGCSCVEWAIFHDEQVGNSVHLMTEDVDEGDVLTTEPLSFPSQATYQDIRVAVYEAGFRLLANATHNLSSFVTDRTAFKPQSEGRYFPPIDPDSMAEVLKKIRDGRYKYQSLSTTTPLPRSS